MVLSANAPERATNALADNGYDVAAPPVFGPTKNWRPGRDSNP